MIYEPTVEHLIYAQLLSYYCQSYRYKVVVCKVLYRKQILSYITAHTFVTCLLAPIGTNCQ